MRSNPFLLGLLVLAVAMAACGGENRGSGSRMGAPTIPGTQGFQVPPLPPDSFTRVDTLTLRNPTIQTPYLQQGKDSLTATTLRTGLVIVIGGTAGGTALQETEVYDQRSAEFTLSGLVGQARRHHTATLTSAGDIVVIGGVGQSLTPLISAEIWESATGTYTTVSQMRTPRVGHTATSLPSGEILVVGGFTDSIGEFVTYSTEALNLSTTLWREHTPIQATNSQEGMPRALQSATTIAGPDGQAGNGDDLVIFMGGVQGNRTTGKVTNLTSSVVVYYPNEQTQPPGKPSLPGAWRNLGVNGVTSGTARLGHHAFVVAENKDISQILFVGGLGGTVPTIFGPYTETAPGMSYLEDSPGPLYTFGILQIDVPSLSATNPQGDVPGVACIGDPNPLTGCPPFTGGFGARAVHSPKRFGVMYCGGNTYVSPPPARVAYNRNAWVIEMAENPMTGLVMTASAIPSAGSMGDIRSFHAITLLPGSDGLMDTADDTAFVAGGEQSPSGEQNTADEYTFP